MHLMVTHLSQSQTPLLSFSWVACAHTGIISAVHADYDEVTDTHPFSPTIVTAGTGFLLHPSISTHTELPESTRGAIH